MKNAVRPSDAQRHTDSHSNPRILMKRPLSTTLALCIFVSSSIARAQSPVSAEPSNRNTPTWHVVAGIGTDAPIAIGGRAHVETPFRLRLSTSVGILPKPYVDAVNSFVVSIGGYSDATADLIKSALQSSFVWRTHVGYRPFASLGLYGEVGYGLVTLGGNATGSEIIAGVTGKTLPISESSGSPSRPFDITSTLHMLDVEIGYDWKVAERFELRAALGGAFTIAAKTRITPGYTPRTPKLVDQFAAYGETYLDDTYTSYVFSPVLSLSAGYRFF